MQPKVDWMIIHRCLDKLYVERPMRRYYFSAVLLSEINRTTKVQEAIARLQRNRTIQHIRVRAPVPVNGHKNYFDWRDRDHTGLAVKASGRLVDTSHLELIYDNGVFVKDQCK